MTEEERALEDAKWVEELKSVTVEEYGKAYSKGKLTYNGFSEDFTDDQRREMKDTIDFLRELGASGDYTITWYGTYGDQIVSLDTLVGWLMAGGQRRQKRFTVQAVIRGKIEEYADADAVKAEIDRLMEL